MRCESTIWYDDNYFLCESEEEGHKEHYVNDRLIRENVLVRVTWIAVEDVVVKPEPPMCTNHLEVQHRDRLPPWCNSCGWRHEKPAVAARQIKEM